MILQYGNGIQALIAKREHSPVVAAQLWVKAGSASEDSRHAGAAHYLEHLFLCRRTLPDSALKQLEDMGAHLNGQTTKDYTVYSFVAQAEHLELSLTVLAEALRKPFWTAETLEQEREVILRELETRSADRSWLAVNSIYAEAYAESSYGHPILGTRESIKRMTSAELEQFYSRYYRPDNAVLVITGAADAGAVQEKVRELFGCFPKPDSGIGGMHIRSEGASDSSSSEGYSMHPDYLAAGFKDACVSPERQAVADMIRERMAGQPGFALERYPNRTGGLTVIRTDKPDQTGASLLTTIQGIMAECLQSDWSDSGMRKLQASLLRKRRRDQESVESWAYRLGHQWLFYQIEENYEDYKRRLEQLTWEDAAAFLRQLAGQASVPAGRSESTESNRSPYEHFKAGASSLVLRRRLDSPAAALVVLMANRSLPEWESHPLLPLCMAHYMAVGSPEASALASRLGADISPFVQADSFGIQVEMPAEHAQQGFQLLELLLYKQRFYAEQWQAVVSRMAAKERRTSKTVFNLMQSAAHEAMFEGHIYASSLFASAEPIEAMGTKQALIRGSLELIGQLPAVISACGPFGKQEAQRFMETAGSGQPVSIRHQPVWKASNAAKQIVMPTHAPQVQLFMQFPGVPFADADKFVLHVVCQLLGGTGGRLYRKLREQRQLAYTFTCFSKEFYEGGYITCYAACSAEHAQAAESVMLEEMKQLSEELVSEEELRKAQERLISSYYIKGQSMLAEARMVGLYELSSSGHADMARYGERIRMVTRSQIREAALRYFVAERCIKVKVMPQLSPVRQAITDSG